VACIVCVTIFVARIVCVTSIFGNNRSGDVILKLETPEVMTSPQIWKLQRWWRHHKFGNYRGDYII